MQTITEFALDRVANGVFTREQAALWVEKESLAELTRNAFDEVEAAYESARVLRFLRGLRKDLKR